MSVRNRGPLRLLVGAGLLGTIAVGLAACDGPDDREAKYRERGKVLFERADYGRASVEFRNALQIKPTSVEAIFYLGRIAEAQGDLQNARRTYERAFQQNEAFLPALIKLGELALAALEPAKAQEMAERALKVAPGSASAHALSGAVMLHRGLTTLAEEAARAALKIEAGHPQATIVVASVAAQRGDFDAALAAVDEATKIFPKDVLLRLGRLQVLGKAGREEGVDDAFRGLIEAAPAALQYKIDFAKHLTAKGRVDEAESVFRDAIARDPASVPNKMLLVALLAERRGWDAAEKTLLEFVERAPTGEYAFHFRLAELYTATDRREKARSVLQGVVDKAGTAPGGLSARPQLAKLAIGEGKLREAEQLVGETLRLDANNADALFIRASLASDRREFQPAIVDLRNILRNQPGSAPALKLLADVYRASGEPLLAVDALRTLVTAHPADVAARVAYADQLRVTGQRERAVAEYDTVLRASRDLLPALSGKALASIELGNLVLAESMGKYMLGLSGGEGPGNTVLGLVALQKKDATTAIANFTKARAASPKSRDTLAQLVHAYDATGQREAGIRLLKDAIDSQPSDGDARVMLADLQFNLGRLDEAEASLRQAIAAQPQSAVPYLKLGSLYLKSARTAAAVDTFRDGTGKANSNLELWLQLAVTQEATSDYDGARQAYEAVLGKDPRHLAASNNLAMLIADNWPRDNALMTQARRLAEPFRDSGNPALLDTLGWILVRLGNLADAVQVLEKAVGLAPNEPQIRYHLGLAYHTQGDLARARSELQKAIAGEPRYRGIDDARRLLASN